MKYVVVLGWGGPDGERPSSTRTTSIKKEKKDPEETKRILDQLLKDDVEFFFEIPYFSFLLHGVQVTIFSPLNVLELSASQ